MAVIPTTHARPLTPTGQMRAIWWEAIEIREESGLSELLPCKTLGIALLTLNDLLTWQEADGDPAIAFLTKGDSPDGPATEQIIFTANRAFVDGVHVVHCADAVDRLPAYIVPDWNQTDLRTEQERQIFALLGYDVPADAVEAQRRDSMGEEDTES